MYLIGILLWGTAAALIAWLIAVRFARRTTNRWWIKGLALLMFPIVFIAPLVDEIIGKYQFELLCEGATEVKIYATHPVGNELYTADGMWRGSDTGDDVFQLEATKKRILHWDHKLSAAGSIASIIPIGNTHTRVLDKTNNNLLLAEWDSYATPGGWLGRYLGGGIVVQHDCSPMLVKRSHLEMSVLPFNKIQGAKQ